jgi:bifunctional non-homologous end joining protein LigD
VGLAGVAQGRNQSIIATTARTLYTISGADWSKIQYVEHAEGHGGKMFAAVCHLGLEGIVSKKLNAPYRSGLPKSAIDH